MSEAQAKALAELAIADCNDPKQYKDALGTAPSVDMALFGRMVADAPSLNYDAAAQVAHSISTHAVQNEFDYFTAVDDCAPEDSAGAGHLGTVEYNSSTLYRYATVNMVELVHLLGAEKAAQAVRVFGEAFIRSMPTGKQNSFANRTLPDAVYVTLREDQPVNLCGAFEKPVRKSPEGYAEPSKTALEAIRAAGVCLLCGCSGPELCCGHRAGRAGPGHAPEPDAHRAGTCRKGEAARK